MKTFEINVKIGKKSINVTLEDLRDGITINLGNVITVIEKNSDKEPYTTITTDEAKKINLNEQK